MNKHSKRNPRERVGRRTPKRASMKAIGEGKYDRLRHALDGVRTWAFAIVTAEQQGRPSDRAARTLGQFKDIARREGARENEIENAAAMGTRQGTALKNPKRKPSARSKLYSEAAALHQRAMAMGNTAQGRALAQQANQLWARGHLANPAAVFGWSTPAPNWDGSIPKPWRVAHANVLSSRLADAGYLGSAVYVDYWRRNDNREALWIGARDNRDPKAHSALLNKLATLIRSWKIGKVQLVKEGGRVTALLLIDSEAKYAMKTKNPTSKAPSKYTPAEVREIKACLRAYNGKRTSPDTWDQARTLLLGYGIDPKRPPAWARPKAKTATTRKANPKRGLTVADLRWVAPEGLASRAYGGQINKAVAFLASDNFEPWEDEAMRKALENVPDFIVQVFKNVTPKPGLRAYRSVFVVARKA